MSESKQGNTNMLFGFLFTLIAVVALIALVLVKSQADNVGSTAAVGNATPTVDSVTIATSSLGSAAPTLTLTSGTTTTFYMHGTASDNNGCEDINDADGTTEKYTAKFYRTNVGGTSSCTADNTNCYDVTEADLDLTNCTTGGSDLSINYEFDFPIQFYADATDAGSSPDYSATSWTAYVSVADTAGASASNSSTTEIATLNGLSMSTASVAYGSLALGATSSAQSVVTLNKGNNNAFDPRVSMAADWSCVIGTITKANNDWSLTSGGTYTDLTTSATAVDLNITKQTSATESSGTFYTKLTIPATGVGGDCTSTLVVGAS